VFLDDGAGGLARAYAWAVDSGPDGRQPVRWLSLAGDSAGGNLAAATCLLVGERQARSPDRLGLIAGSLDNIPAGGRIGRDDPLCTPEGFANSAAAYLPPGVTADDPHVSPIYAARDQLARFPPTLIQVSGAEALLYDSRRFAERLQAADVQTLLSVWPGLPHVWHCFLGQLPEAEAALRELACFLDPPEQP